MIASSTVMASARISCEVTIFGPWLRLLRALLLDHLALLRHLDDVVADAESRELAGRLQLRGAHASLVALELLLNLVHGLVDGLVHVLGFDPATEHVLARVNGDVGIMKIALERQDGLGVDGAVKILLQMADALFEVALQGFSRVDSAESNVHLHARSPE